MKLDALKDTLSHSLNGTMKFPQIVGILTGEGVEAYHIDYVRGEARYYNQVGESFVLPIDHQFPKAAANFSADLVSASIKKSQQGLIDYKTFTAEVMDAGCVYYIAYLKGKKVVYFGREGDMHIEHFPK